MLVIFSVPLVVIGLPVTEMPVPAVAATEVTVPNVLSPPPVGGPTCRSSSEVGLLPAPVRLNKFKKNRYHSRDISPVRWSMKSTRAEGMLVRLF